MVIAFRFDALSHHYLYPRVLTEEFIRIAPYVSPLSKRVDTARKRVRDLHVAILAPKLTVVSLGHMVVQDDEVANLLDLVACFLVVMIDQRLRDAAKRKETNEPAYSGNDEVNACGLQRLDETASQPKCNDVFVPDSTPVSRLESYDSRLFDRRTFDRAQQLVYRLIVRHVATAIDQTVAHAMLQRNAPAPTGFMRDRSGVRYCWTDHLGLQRDSTIANEPMRPIFVPGAKGLLDQETAKTGTVDEEITIDSLARFQHESFYESRFSVLLDILDLAFHPLHTEALGELPKEFRIDRRFEMICIVDLRLRR